MPRARQPHTRQPHRRRTVAIVAIAVGALTTLGAAPIASLAEGTAEEAATTSPDATVARVATDLVAPGVIASPRAAAPIRITTRVEQRETIIEASVEHRDNEVLAVGVSRIDSAGVPGVRHDTVEVVRHNGVVVSETITSTHVVAPTPIVVSVGTATSESASKDWAALAECESGGDPTIVSRSGTYHGLYQFDVSTWRSVGGEGLPSQAPPDEQTARAMALYDERGSSPWPSCGRHL